MTTWNSFTGVIEACEGEGSWYTVAVPQELSETFKDVPKGNFGYIAITAKVSSSQWDTSLLPAGNGRYFVAIPAKVRKAQHLSCGDTITFEYCFRMRNS